MPASRRNDVKKAGTSRFDCCPTRKFKSRGPPSERTESGPAVCVADVPPGCVLSAIEVKIRPVEVLSPTILTPATAKDLPRGAKRKYLDVGRSPAAGVSSAVGGCRKS